MNIKDIVKRTVKSAERNTPKPVTTQPSKVPTPNTIESIMPVFHELLNHSKIGNTFLKELLTHQRTQSQLIPMTKDPRKQVQPITAAEYAEFLTQMGIDPTDDAEMIDAAKTSDTAEAQAQPGWLEGEAPVPIEGAQADEAVIV